MALGGGEGLATAGTARDTRFAAVHAAAAALVLASRGAQSLRSPSAFPELDCIRDRLPPHVIELIERRAAAAGNGADRVLIDFGIMDEDSYMRSLARWLGLPFETFDDRTRASC